MTTSPAVPLPTPGKHWLDLVEVDVLACVHQSRLRIAQTRDLIDSLQTLVQPPEPPPR